MNIVFFLANATISFFLKFLSVSLEFLFAEIWKVERRRAVKRIRLGFDESVSGIFREIDRDYSFDFHPFGNDLLREGRVGSSFQCSSCKKHGKTESVRFSNFIFRIIEKKKTDHEVPSELSESDADFCAVFEDLFDDAYAEVSYVISPRKCPQPNGR